MPAYRCISCDINFPPAQKEPLGGQCARCGAVLTYYTNLASHRDWRRRSALAETTKEEPQEEVAPWGIHPAEDSCPVIYDNNHDVVYVQDKDLRSLGYLPEAGDVVKLNGKYYELLGINLRGKMWWVEPFYFTKESEEIFALPTETGPSSDDIVVLDHEGKTIYWDSRKDPFRELMEGDGKA